MNPSTSTRAAPRRALFAPRFPNPRRADSGLLVLCVWVLLGWATFTVAASRNGAVAPAGSRPAGLVASSDSCTLQARC